LFSLDYQDYQNSNKDCQEQDYQEEQEEQDYQEEIVNNHNIINIY
jgi:hypothetical protein